MLQQYAQINETCDTAEKRGRVKALCEQYDVNQRTLTCWAALWAADIRQFDDRAVHLANRVQQLQMELDFVQQRYAESQARKRITITTDGLQMALVKSREENSVLRAEMTRLLKKYKLLGRQLKSSQAYGRRWHARASEKGLGDKRYRTQDT